MFKSHYSRGRNAALLLAAGAFSALLNTPALAQAKRAARSPVKRAAQQVAVNKFWKQADAEKLLPDNQINPITSSLVTFGAYQMNMNALLAALKQAPKEFSVDIRKSPLVVSLPMPDGTFSRFTVVESSIVSAQIAAAHPEFKTYVGQGIDDPAATARLDHTPDGFHAMILSPKAKLLLIPTRGARPAATSVIARRILFPRRQASNAKFREIMRFLLPRRARLGRVPSSPAAPCCERIVWRCPAMRNTRRSSAARQRAR